MLVIHTGVNFFTLISIQYFPCESSITLFRSDLVLPTSTLLFDCQIPNVQRNTVFSCNENKTNFHCLTFRVSAFLSSFIKLAKANSEYSSQMKRIHFLCCSSVENILYIYLQKEIQTCL